MQKVLKGVVVSNKMDGTVVVRVEQRKFHTRYKKLIVRTKRLAVDRNGLTVSLGDRVCIKRTKRMSKTKNWRLVSILSEFERSSTGKKWDDVYLRTRVKSI